MWAPYLTRVQVPGLRGLTEETECESNLIIMLQQMTQMYYLPVDVRSRVYKTALNNLTVILVSY